MKMAALQLCLVLARPISLKAAVSPVGVNVILAIMILIISVSLGLFYIQTTCQNILRREFDPARLRSVVSSFRLEFLFVRKEVEQSDAPVDYRWARMALNCDYMALTYLLKNASQNSYSGRERLLTLYFKTLSLFVFLAHVLKLNEKRAMFKQTAILNYFASTLGEQVGELKFSSLSA
jgi:hypothetical protein